MHDAVAADVAEVEEHDVAPEDHGDAHCGLHKKADFVAHLQDVVGKAGDEHHDHAEEEGMQLAPEQGIELADDTDGRERGGQNADAAHEGSDGVVRLVTARGIDNAQPVRSNNTVAYRNDGNGHTQQEKRQRQHLFRVPIGKLQASDAHSTR